MILCSFEFALRNTLSFKLNFCVQIYFCVLCDSRVQKRNSEFNLSWPHPSVTSRFIPIRVASRTDPDKNYVQIQKTAFRLEYITKLIVQYQAEQTDDFIRHSVFENLLYRTMLSILLSALIIINL